MAKDNFWGRMFGGVFGGSKTWENAFNKAWYQFLGGQAAQYDYEDSTYLEKGYGINPDVFAVVNQMCDKTKAVPYAVKKGVMISINPDAHSIAEIDNIRWGVSAARKAGLTREMTWNAMGLKGIEKWLEKKR